MVLLTNKKKKNKTKRKNFQTIVEGHLKEDFEGCKKMEKDNEFKAKTIPDELQPLLPEFTDITPS